jgi:DNA repair exonuclease SbcCD ATPase subunit
MTDIVDKKVLNELGIVFKTVKFKNFMSFGNLFTEVDLEGSGTTLLMGENLDKGGSSGAGKSTLINAISYCLYDKIPANVSKDKLINRTNDKKITNMEVELTFTKGDDVYQVRRWRGGSTGVELLCNDLDMTPASVNRGEDSFNSKVEEILGFSYNLFSQIILFNGNSTAFLDLSVNAQRMLIEELFRITMLSRKAVALKKMISDLEKNISLQKLLIQQQEKQNDIHRQHVAAAIARITNWEAVRAQELGAIQTKLEASASIDFETEEIYIDAIDKIRQEISALQTEIRELNLADLSEARELAAKKQSEIRELQTKRSAAAQQTSSKKAQLTISTTEATKLNRDQATIEKELVHLRDAKCPYCLQQFEDAQSKIGDLEAKNQTLSTEISLLADKLIELKTEVEQFDTQVKDQVAKFDEAIAEASKPEPKVDSPRRGLIVEKTTQMNELQDQLNEIQGMLRFTDIGSLLKAKNEITTLQSRLESMVIEDNPHIEAHEALIKEGEVKVDIDALDELILTQEHQQFLLKLLTDKNSFIRKNIISKTIPFLNKRIAYYTESINLPHIVLFQPDMTCEITQIGRDLDHGNLSNGEKKMLNLSLCLAFRDVLTYLHSKVNVLFTDEVDGGSISGPDVDSLITMLKSKAWDDDISIFIISHRPEFDGRCDNNLVIRKEGGFSTLILQPDA